MKIERNKPCPCGSGKKYKKCCLMDKEKNEELMRAMKLAKSETEVTEILSKPLKLYSFKVSLLSMAFKEISEEVSCVIEANGKVSLYDLHLEIQEALNWDNDHMFSFYLGEDRRDRKNEYSANPLGEHYKSSFGEPSNSASETEIRDLDLQKGQSFSYLFDYGDELLHKVVVESIEDVKTSEVPLTKITAKTGEAPDQYDY